MRADARSALEYLDAREQIAAEHTDELVWFARGRVPAHMRVKDYNDTPWTQRGGIVREAAAKLSLRPGELFVERVFADQDELRQPYESAAS